MYLSSFRNLRKVARYLYIYLFQKATTRKEITIIYNKSSLFGKNKRMRK